YRTGRERRRTGEVERSRPVTLPSRSTTASGEREGSRDITDGLRQSTEQRVRERPLPHVRELYDVALMPPSARLCRRGEGSVNRRTHSKDLSRVARGDRATQPWGADVLRARQVDIRHRLGRRAPRPHVSPSVVRRSG